MNGERRSFALLRPIVDTTAHDAIRDLILQAYAEHETALVDAGPHHARAPPGVLATFFAWVARVSVIPIRTAD